MKNTINVLFTILVLVSCSSQASRHEELFLSAEMNEILRAFIDSSPQKEGTNYYQVNIGINRQGAKISIMESACYVNESFYWFDSLEPKYLGFFLLDSDSIRVFASSDENIQNYINMNVLNNSSITTDRINDNLKVRASYYQISGVLIKQVFPEEVELLTRQYYYHPLNDGLTSQLLLLLSEPKYYEMVLSDMVIFGTWEKDSEDIIRFTPFKFYYYSASRSELVEEPVNWQENKNPRTRQCAAISEYSCHGDTLFPLNIASKEYDYFWIQNPQKN
ncbi:MAG: hypothetical protein IKG92_04640 [Bacteroidales bacterium]|nr:hypothetical protein [Bacteroidales bacterium]